MSSERRWPGRAARSWTGRRAGRDVALVLALLVLLASGVSGCGGDGATPAAESATDAATLHDLTWEWSTMKEQPDGPLLTLPSPERYTLILHADGRLEGRADCRSFTGRYQLEDGVRLDIQPDETPDCGPFSWDRAYLGWLEAAVAGGPDGGGGLALETPGGARRLVFRRGGAAP